MRSRLPVALNVAQDVGKICNESPEFYSRDKEKK